MPIPFDPKARIKENLQIPGQAPPDQDIALPAEQAAPFLESLKDLGRAGLAPPPKKGRARGFTALLGGKGDSIPLFEQAPGLEHDAKLLLRPYKTHSFDFTAERISS